MTSSVYLAKCPNYDIPALTSILAEAFDALGIGEERIRGKRILLKPNLVLAKTPDQGATTHPAFVSACVELLSRMGAASITLADSPGGPFNASSLAHVYKTCGMEDIADERLKLNDDFTADAVFPRGEKLKTVHVLHVFSECDVIIDLCKLKSHNLTGMSCATKNLFGLIPGTEKFETHSAFPEVADFSEMLVDLASYVLAEKDFIAICDAVLSMEGNGPTHGIPKMTGYLLVSESPFALDTIAAHIMKRDGEILHINAAAKRGLAPEDWREIEMRGLSEVSTFDFVLPDADSGTFLRGLPDFMGGRFTKLFEPRPEILKKSCVGCGKCASSCPRRTIEMVKHGKKRQARIHRENCIKCYCCQELCPIGAVGIHRNPIIKIIH